MRKYFSTTRRSVRLLNFENLRSRIRKISILIIFFVIRHECNNCNTLKYFDVYILYFNGMLYAKRYSRSDRLPFNFNTTDKPWILKRGQKSFIQLECTSNIFFKDRGEKYLNTGRTQIWERNKKGIFYVYYRDQQKQGI